MDFQNIQTVKELIHALKQYNPNRGTWNIETKMHGRKANNCR